VRTWGTLREALREGHTEARVEVDEVAGPRLVGVGAVAGLDGEITIVDGDCYVSRVRAGEVETVRSSDVAATLLFAADVSEWRTLEVAKPLAPGALEGFVEAGAAAAGLDTTRPFPFVIEGDLSELEAHVIAGQCPTRAAVSGEPLSSPPAYVEYGLVRGRLVGIWASAGGGVITHHGSAVHVHAVVEGDAPFTGHCDAVGVAAGAVLRLPVR
jgi:alpha-acetolactate decarboxylase